MHWRAHVRVETFGHPVFTFNSSSRLAPSMPESSSPAPPAPSSDEPTPEELRQLIFDVVKIWFKGEADLQKHLLAILDVRHGVSNGCAHAHIEAMAEDGLLRFEQHGPKRRHKMIIAVQPPSGPAPRCGPDGRVRFYPPTNFFAMTRLARARARFGGFVRRADVTPDRDPANRSGF